MPKLPSLPGALMKLIIEADGGSRGNPGLSGAGAVVIDAASGNILREISEAVGIATNNVAEYSAVIFALEAAFEIDPAAEIVVRMDSKLVVEQMSGRWKIKHPDMLSLGARVQQLISGKNVEFVWIPREQNVLADALANKAMDGEPAPTAAAGEFNHVAPSSIRAPQSSVAEATTLIMVRHGRTALTESRKISGGDGENPDLSELGNKDAAEVALELARVGSSGAFSFVAKPVVVIHSPVKRAAQTARKIAQKLGAELVELADLREIGFGDWDGLTNEELFVGHETQYQAWRGSYDVAPPNGESLKEFDFRVNRSLDFILNKFAGKTVVVVAHVMPIRGLLRIANDASVAGYWRVDLGPASISIARFWGREGAEIVCVNSTSHLSS
ncbi:MAG: bifunctional RNase H/acid phosphatase [Rhodoluna sp.]|nr:bifunctional RNase H/acid phosphatase [Rhodoluna sp.]